MAKKPETKQDISDRTDLPHDQVFLGVGQDNGGALFVMEGRKLVRLEQEGPAFRNIMETCGSARRARAEASKGSTL